MVGTLSDIGIVRKLNEDYLGYYEGEHESIYVIADGMGGHNAGEVASKLAVELTINYFKNNSNNQDLESIIKSAVTEANSKIFQEAQIDKSLKGMGTTITACLINNKKIVVANVGDSSCYVIKDNQIIKVTKDHSLVQQLIDAGTITEEEALNHPNKNIITRALGTSKVLDIDIFTLELKGIEKVILCTDGLTNVVSKEEIYDIAINNNNEIACGTLIELSKYKGSRDNISIIIFEGECRNGRNCS